jgi:hypothetical protein
MKLNLLVLALLTSATLSTQEEMEGRVKHLKGGLKFVFEINRHGARGPMANPMDPNFGEGFQFGVDNLTPMGMRMRTLLGMHARKRYANKHISEDEPFLDPLKSQDQIYIESTDVLRTLQSVKSELMGLMPAGSDGHPELDENELNSLKEGKSRPRFGIRNFDKMTEELGRDALIHGFFPLAVFNHQDKTPEMKINYEGCGQLNDSYNYYVSDPSTFSAQNAIFDGVLFEPVRQAMNYTEAQMDEMRAAFRQILNQPEAQPETLDYLIIYFLADAIVARQFEGLDVGYDFSHKEQFLVDNAQKWPVFRVFDEQTRNLFMSRIFQQPLKQMDNIINHILAGEDYDGPKYILYSAHDTQLGNLVDWFNPDNLRINTIPFASSLFFELHYNEDCIYADKSCFFIKVFYNNKPISIQSCLDEMSEDGTDCNYLSLRSHFDEVMSKGNLNEACSYPFVPMRLN